MPTNAFVISSLPGLGLRNPYVDLFYDALRSYGFVLYNEPVINSDWARSHFKHINALHFHWPEYIWRETSLPAFNHIRRFVRSHIPGAWRFLDADPKPSANNSYIHNSFRLWSGVRRFQHFLEAASHANIHIIWTVHNLRSHDHWGFFDRLGYSVLAHHSDLLIFHSLHARDSYLRTYGGDKKYVVMPHGNYDGVFPAPHARDTVLIDLGLDPRKPVVGCIGALRAYKGLNIACEAVRILKGKVQLICAGNPHSTFPESRVRKLLRNLPCSALVSKPLTNQEFSDYCSACDVILLPYTEITGSGALMAALTLSRPVIASDLPYFREILLRNPLAGMLVNPGDANDLARAIEYFVTLPTQMTRLAARTLADQYAWSEVIKPVINALHIMQS